MQNEDEVTFLVEHDELMQNFFITINSTGCLKMSELSACIRSLAEDIDKDPEGFLLGFSLHAEEGH